MNPRPRPDGFHVLVVEDDRTLREGLCEALEREGYRVTTAADGHEAEHQLGGGGFDLIVLDLMLPGPGGLELLRTFRALDVDTPVVILTARSEESDKVLGLELGADDYVTKPFGLRELKARVRAWLRRARRFRDAEDASARFALGQTAVDLAAFEVHRDGRTETLSPKEAAILGLLHARAGKAVHRNEILDQVWGRGTVLSNRTIDTHVLHLRQKLGEDPGAPRFVRTVHGIGYRLVLPGGRDG